MTIGQFLNDSPLSKSESREILCNVLKCDSSFLVLNTDMAIQENDIIRIQEICTKRNTGMPLAYVLENRAFYHCNFYTPQGVLIPQPDTEILVEKAVEYAASLKDKDSLNILDLCAGTGCIGISVAKELSGQFKDVNLTLSDISEKAFEVFSENCSDLIVEKNIHVKKVLGNLFENINDKFDLILSNPPYIKTSVIPELETEVQYEPVLALDGGRSGTELIEKIVSSCKAHALENCAVFMEIGYDQGQEVKSLFEHNSLVDVEIIKDLGHRDRVVKGLFK